jgi:hypothetical protein
MSLRVALLCTSLSGGTRSTHRENRGFRTQLSNRLPDLYEEKKTDPWDIEDHVWFEDRWMVTSSCDE